MLDAAELRRILERNEVPRGRMLGDEDVRPIEVAVLLAHVRKNHPDESEASLDRLVGELGGRKDGVSSVRQLPLNLLRKRRGASQKLSDPVYRLPDGL